jgi:fumarate hydratase subunit beta
VVPNARRFAVEMITHVYTPLTDEVIAELNMGQKVLISGTLFTGRDAAHKRLAGLAEAGETFPFNVEGQIIYYVGPTPPKPGMAIGSAGPTSSYRMDVYTTALLARGLKGMIGKGARGKEVIEAMKQFRAVYFAATGGAGALISKSIKKAEVVAYEDLGTEAIRRLEVEDFPATVVIDVYGNDLYEQGRSRYQKK